MRFYVITNSITISYWTHIISQELHWDGTGLSSLYLLTYKMQKLYKIITVSVKDCVQWLTTKIQPKEKLILSHEKEVWCTYYSFTVFLVSHSPYSSVSSSLLCTLNLHGCKITTDILASLSVFQVEGRHRPLPNDFYLRFIGCACLQGKGGQYILSPGYIATMTETGFC